MAKKSVFISYRRDDSAGFSHTIHDRLIEFLPRDRVFMDVAGIETGADFARKIEAALDQCGVLVVLIGPRWAGDGNAAQPRLQEAGDWVRLELATALRRGITVIPVLLDGADMPSEASLPEDVRPLRRFNAMHVRGSRAQADLWDLAGAVMRALGETWPPAEPGAVIYAIVSGLYAFFAGAALLLVLFAAMLGGGGTVALLGTCLFMLNALVILRLPLHTTIRDLTRQQALRIGAVLHLVAFTVMAVGASETEWGFAFLFGFLPAAVLFLAAFAMQRRAPSSAPAARPTN
jgi:hypothetical protein